MRVLVCGSRDWPSFDAVWTRLRELGDGTEVISGGARGADQFAEVAATRLGYALRVFPADWKGKGGRAGILRNLQMLDERPDLVIAFQCHGSRGTQHTIDEARRRGIPVEVCADEASIDDYWEDTL